jgi:hypothetical protein
MITKSEWKRVYNEVFCIHPPSLSMKVNIKYTSNGQTSTYKDMKSFYRRLFFERKTTINSNDVEYTLEDESLYNELIEYLKQIREE